MRSIQGKFLTLITAGLVIMTLALCATTTWVTTVILHTNADSNLEAVCEREAAKVDQMLGTVEAVASLLGSHVATDLSGGEHGYSLDVPAECAELISHMKPIAENTAINTPYVLGYFLRLDPALTGSPTDGFHYFRDDQDSDFYGVEVTDFSLYEESDPAVEWFYLPKQEHEPLWCDPIITAVGGDRVAAYSAPIMVDGSFVGVFGFEVELSIIEAAVREMTIYDGSVAYIEDASGRMLFYHGAEELIDSSTDRQHQVSRNISNSMKLIIKADYNDLQREGYRLTYLMLAISVVIIAIFFVITYVITVRLVRPLRRLAEVAQNFGAGELVTEGLALGSRDEVGILSRAFVDSAEKLGDAMRYINTLAYRDSLTGLKNRTAYEEAASAVNRSIMDSDCSFAVFVADVNGLKTTNDTYGHDAGNRVIIHAAKLINSVFYHSTVYRIGGDEFVVIVEGDAAAGCEELIREFDLRCQSETLSYGDIQIKLTVARGMAVYSPELDKSFEDVFNRADSAMYANKKESRTEGH